jgi:hypothetical protein
VLLSVLCGILISNFAQQNKSCRLFYSRKVGNTINQKTPFRLTGKKISLAKIEIPKFCAAK